MSNVIKRLEGLEIAVMVLSEEIAKLNPDAVFGLEKLNQQLRKSRGDFTADDNSDG